MYDVRCGEYLNGQSLTMWTPFQTLERRSTALHMPNKLLTKTFVKILTTDHLILACLLFTE